SRLGLAARLRAPAVLRHRHAAAALRFQSGSVPPPAATKANVATATSTITPPPPSGANGTSQGSSNGGSGRHSRWRYVKYALYAFVSGGITYSATKVYMARHPPVQAPPDTTKKTLVILGTGWGAMSMLKGIDSSLYNIVVVSPRNYFLFTPLLPSCTVGTIEHRSIMEPIHYITRHKQR
ncbi:NADH:ubiquinone oxidoreductase, partial [Tieghemiomyces parasiticus]